MSLNPKLWTSVPGSQLPPRTKVVYHPESLLHRLTGLSLLALAEEPYMNCSTPESSAVLVVDHTGKPNGAGLSNLLDPEANDLTEASLEKLLVQIMDNSLFCRPAHPDGVALTSARHPDWHGYESWSLRQRRLPNTRLARVAREEMEDGLIPPRSIRGWSFVAEFAFVDRRRVKRMLRRHYQRPLLYGFGAPRKGDRNVPVRNYGAGHQRVRA